MFDRYNPYFLYVLLFVLNSVFYRVREEADNVWGGWCGGALEHGQRQQGLLKVCHVRNYAGIPVIHESLVRFLITRSWTLNSTSLFVC